MRRSVWLFLFLVLCGRAAVAWAGPAEEIAQVDEQAVKALNDGNLDAYMALHADDAVLTPSGAPFRIEGKEAVRSFFAGLFQNFPTRRFVERQRTIRVYGDSTGILNAYFTVTLVDRAGAVNTVHARMSVTFVRMGGRWLVADDHASRLP